MTQYRQVLSPVGLLALLLAASKLVSAEALQTQGNSQD
jgi:hypothetical protein